MINIHFADALAGAIVGALGAVLGIIINHYLDQERIEKEQKREAISKLVSCIILQYRNLEKTVNLHLSHKMKIIILSALRRGTIKTSPQSIESLEEEIKNTILESYRADQENNRLDMEIITNLSIIQKLIPGLGKRICGDIYKYVGGMPNEYSLTEAETLPLFGREGATTILFRQKTANALIELKKVHNDILVKLDHPDLVRP